MKASVLFVCLGNICRSPAAEGILREMAKESQLDGIHVESCGIGEWHIGELPDERMREATAIRGVNLTSRAQQFKEEFLNTFDHILVVDREVMKELYFYAKSAEQKAKIQLITAYSKSYPDEEIPDPYYQGGGAFDHVINMLEDSCEGLLEEIRKGSKTNG